mgnify:CR=1 FL=1
MYKASKCRAPNKMNPRGPQQDRSSLMSKVKDKERILIVAKERHLVTYREAPIRLSSDFSTETLQARRDWREIFKVMKTKKLQQRLLYPAEISLRIEGQIKSFQIRKS